jgi:hypothetical protein
MGETVSCSEWFRVVIYEDIVKVGAYGGYDGLPISEGGEMDLSDHEGVSRSLA